MNSLKTQKCGKHKYVSAAQSLLPNYEATQ